MAEKEGFEPSIPFWGIHDFQSCALGQLRDFSLSSPNIIPYSGRFVKSQFFVPLKSASFSHLSNLIDKETEKWYSNGTIENLSAPWALGRIGNPVRIRNGTAAVCAEVGSRTKVGHWRKLRRRCQTWEALVRRPAWVMALLDRAGLCAEIRPRQL